MVAEALSALIMNTTNVSLDEYKYVIENKSKLKIERPKEITQIGRYKIYHEKIFRENFDRWEIEEAGNLYLSLNTLSLLWEKKAKSMNKEISKIYQEIADITKLYLQRAKEADKASKFMDTFLVKNQEVLEVLA